MRVLWTSNIVLPDAAKAAGLSPPCGGSWMTALAHALVRGGKGIELGVVTIVPGVKSQRHEVGGVTYYLIAAPRRGALSRPTKKLCERFAAVVRDFRPELIHVNGSEFNYGLLAATVAPDIPRVLSLQGLISEYAKVYLGGLPWSVPIIWRTLRDWIRLDGLLEQPFKWRRRARREREIVRATSHLIGRTAWDREFARTTNPAATYYHCDELLRPEFFAARWTLAQAERHTLFVSAANYPIKGLHVLLRAMAQLKRDYPELRVRVAGAGFASRPCDLPRARRWRATGYQKYLWYLIRIYGLEDHLTALGMLDASAFAAELVRARAFVLPSFAENSPNSLSEAMLVGTPCVASYVGGVPSLVTPGEDVLCFPPGDDLALTAHLRALFEDEELCTRLSQSSRLRAQKRHDQAAISQTMIEIYLRLISDTK